MRQRHGIPDARKVNQYMPDIQSVHVTDFSGEVLLSLGTATHPAGLTPEQADFLAAQLNQAAIRARGCGNSKK